MRYLLDTNILSEAAKPHPNPAVMAWLGEQSELDLAISVLTLGEIERGIRLLSGGRKREWLSEWLRVDLASQFQGRVISIDEQISMVWGGLTADARASGRELPVIDGLLLSTAAAHGMTLVTRNERDCGGRGVEIFNPWVE